MKEPMLSTQDRIARIIKSILAWISGAAAVCLIGYTGVEIVRAEYLPFYVRMIVAVLCAVMAIASLALAKKYTDSLF